MTQDNKQNVSEEIDLQKLWGILVDGKKLLIAAALLGLVLGLVYLLVVKPTYRADALLQVEKKQSGLAMLGGLEGLTGQEGSAQTEVELIKSRLVLASAVKELGLDVTVMPKQGFLGRLFLGSDAGDNRLLFSGWASDGEVLWVEHLELEEKMQGNHLTLTALGNEAFSVSSEGMELLKGKVGQELAYPGVIKSLLIKELNVPSGKEFLLSQKPLLMATNSLRNALNISERGKNTGILAISIEGENPHKIKSILNAVSNNYFIQNVKRGAEEAEKSLAFLEKQIPEIKAILDSAEEKLNEYRLETESVDLSLETKAVLDRIVGLESKLTELQLKESEVRSLYTKEHPTYQTLLRQRQSFNHEKERLNEQVKGLPETQQEILRLMRDVELNQAIYVQLLNRSEELKIMKAGTVGNVRIIDEAQVDLVPVSPKKGLTVILTTLLGLLGGLAYLIINSLINKAVTTAQEIEEEGISVIATLPVSEDQVKTDQKLKKGKRKGELASTRKQLLAHEHPTDLAVEALRSLRTSLHFLMANNPKKVLMLTGASPGVGKSFVSANLATVLAQTGQKVVLIDADLRKGTIHNYFGLDNKIGLSAWLAGNQNDLLLQDTNVEGLKVVTRGVVPPNPAELLMQAKLDGLVDRLSQEYDVVIIDTPPILAVTDAAIIARTVTASILVARYELSHAKEIKQAFDVFERAGKPINAAILNAVQRTASNYGYYYAYEYK